MNVTFTRRGLVAGGVTGVCPSAATPGPMASPGIPIDTILTINGREQRLSHDIRASLRDTLREHGALTATTPDCDHGACGGCVVRIDGESKPSCLVLTVAAQGRDITTIDGVV